MLYVSDIICSNMLVKQNSLETALAINEYSNCPGICLHVVFSINMFTSNITEGFEYKVILTLSVEMNNPNMLLVFTVYLLKITLQSRHGNFFLRMFTFPVSKCTGMVFTKT